MDSTSSSLPPRAPGSGSGPGSTPTAPPSSKIQHTPGGIGHAAPAAELPAVRLDDPPAVAGEAPSAVQKIKMFGKAKRHEEQWSRTPNTTGQGAIHIKTFHCKLTEDALNYMDQVINEWLDSHPQYEVKFVNATIGTFTGKLKEPALICQVWV